MARKQDLVRNDSLDWNAYAGLEADASRTKIYSDTQVVAAAVKKWYWQSIKRKRLTSFAVRWFSFACLFAGTLLPVLGGLSDLPQIRLNCTQTAVGLLAAAGLLQLADRVFGWSSGWLRYITTVMAMEAATHSFDVGWAKLLILNGSKRPPDGPAVYFELSEQLLKELDRLQGEETKGWVAEFNTGMALLDTAIKTQRDDAQKQLDALKVEIAKAQAAEAAAKESKEKADAALQKSNQKGAVNATLAFKSAPQRVKISVDDEVKNGSFLGTAWAMADLAPGLHRIAVETLDEPKAGDAKAIKIEPGAITSVTLELK